MSGIFGIHFGSGGFANSIPNGLGNPAAAAAALYGVMIVLAQYSLMEFIKLT
jgi:hypothetical protein